MILASQLRLVPVSTTLCSVLLLYLLYTSSRSPSSPSYFSSHGPISASSRNPGFSDDFIAFWRDLAAALEAARPTCPPINVTAGEMSHHDKSWEPLKRKNRPDRITLPEEDEKELATKHRLMRVAARRLAPALPVGEGTGIVTTGGLKLVPILMVSLRMLRKTGNTLPVEVWLGDRDEYAEVKDICESVLPKLNAQCRVIGDIYAKAEGVAPPDHFQFKVLAMLFSGFEHVLFFDADAMPVYDPAPLLKSPPYTTHGLITFPGIYANAASDHFYHIASIPAPPPTRGTESGIILLNKSFHRESLLMMVYYNYHGPSFYYPLQAQNGPGQGDKETFAAGAQAVNMPYYQVKTPVTMIGVHVEGKYVFAGVGQADPMQDWIYDPPTPTHIENHKDYVWSKDDVFGNEDFRHKARPLFVHTVSSDTKLDPRGLLREGGLAYASAEDRWHRIWGEEKWQADHFGYDVENRMWECVEEEACRIDEEACAQVKRYRMRIFGGAPEQR